jgi:CheY-like chemotaxis protein
VERILIRDHDVAAEVHARDALERIRNGERFDLILCDVMMPDMTGMDLYAALLDVAPEQAERMVFTTGGAFTPRAQAFFDSTPNRRVEKPFTIDVLQSLVRDRLSGRA